MPKTLQQYSDKHKHNFQNSPFKAAHSYLEIITLEVLQQRAYYNGKNNRKKVFQKHKETHQLYKKLLTCQFHPLPNILSVAHIFFILCKENDLKRFDNHSRSYVYPLYIIFNRKFSYI